MKNIYYNEFYKDNTQWDYTPQHIPILPLFPCTWPVIILIYISIDNPTTTTCFPSDFFKIYEEGGRGGEWGSPALD